MKKSRFFTALAALAVALTVMLSAISFSSLAADPGPGAVFDFYYESNADESAFSNVTGCEIEWISDGFIRITSDKDILENDDGIGDVNFYLQDAAFVDLDCDEYPYFAVNLRNPSSATQFEAHFGTDENSLSASCVFHTDIESGMDGFKTFVTYIPTSNVTWVNLLNAPGGLTDQETGSSTAEELDEDEYKWTGYLTQFRVDGLYFGGRSGLDPGGTTLDIAWIAFFKTEEDAKNYQGPDHSAAPGVEETASPGEDDGIPFGTLVFDSDDYDDFWVSPSGVDDIFFNEEESCYELVFTESNDPYVGMDFGGYTADGVLDSIDLDEYKVMQIKIKIDPSRGSSGNLYFTTDEAPGAYSEERNVKYSYEKTEDWQIVNIDCSRQRNWTSELAVTRLDVFSTLPEESSVKIAYITFFKTLAGAKAFAEGGSVFPATPEPTPTPEVTPSPEATAEPDVTEVADETDGSGSEATPSPAKKGCGSVIGTVMGAFFVPAALAAAAVFVRKH